jgi:hypothetical protein
LFAINTATLALAGPGTPDNTSFASPHNIALSPDNQRLYITHLIATASKVSIFDVSNSAEPTLLGHVDVQLNPWGIEAVPAITPEPSAALLASIGASLAFARSRGRASCR